MAQPQPTRMETETRESAAVAARLVAGATPALTDLGQRLRAAPPRFAIGVGRGSSGAAAFFAKYLFEQRLGVATASATPSLRSVYGAELNLADALVLAVSQSGRSPDLVDFCRAAGGPGVLRVGMINAEDSPLHAAVDVALPLSAGPEHSIAATKSCLAAMLLVFGLVAHWRNDSGMLAAFARSPERLASALAEGPPHGAEQFLAPDGPIFVVGRGAGLAIAKEAALKLKETCGLHAEALSAAEIRHGPMALAGPGLRVLAFAQNDPAQASLIQLADDLRGMGTRVLVLRPHEADEEPALELLGMLAQFYLLANATALLRGRSPDHPPRLAKVTETR